LIKKNCITKEQGAKKAQRKLRISLSFYEETIASFLVHPNSHEPFSQLISQ